MPLGRLLRLVPGALAESPAWATWSTRWPGVALRGVRTRGRGEGRAAGVLRRDRRAGGDGADRDVRRHPAGDLRPVDPPCRFGFSSTPRHPR